MRRTAESGRGAARTVSERVLRSKACIIAKLRIVLHLTHGRARREARAGDGDVPAASALLLHALLIVCLFPRHAHQPIADGRATMYVPPPLPSLSPVPSVTGEVIFFQRPVATETTLWVGHLPAEVSSDQLYAAFSRFGPVYDVSPLHRTAGSSCAYPPTPRPRLTSPQRTLPSCSTTRLTPRASPATTFTDTSFSANPAWCTPRHKTTAHCLSSMCDHA